MLTNLGVVKAYLLARCNSCLYFWRPEGLGYTENCLSRPVPYPVNSFILYIGKNCILNDLMEKMWQMNSVTLEYALQWRAKHQQIHSDCSTLYILASYKDSKHKGRLFKFKLVHIPANKINILPNILFCWHMINLCEIRYIKYLLYQL